MHGIRGRARPRSGEIGVGFFEAGDFPQVVDTVTRAALAMLGLLEESADVA